jgi:putative tryptophan/tyrosine transport system substrate-binding protein
MKRREFITLIGGAAAAWPLSARAQPGERVRRVGVIIVNAENDPEWQARIAALRRGLQELRWTEGSNLLIDYRWRVSEPVRARALVGELVRFAPDAVVVNGTPGLAALQDTTRTIPVVFVMVVDPVGAGYVQSLARPGGNITGFLSFEPEIGGKWLELLKEIAPGLRRVAGILDPGFQGFAAVWRAIEILGPRVGLEVTSIAFRNPADDIESAIGAFAKSMEGGLIVLPTAVNNLHRDRIISLAATHRLPAVYPFPPYTSSGGLVSYGINTVDVFRRSASYVDRILRGEKPADLPVQAPTKYELVINLKTARALGLEVPPTLIARADEVIE